MNAKGCLTRRILVGTTVILSVLAALAFLVSGDVVGLWAPPKLDHLRLAAYEGDVGALEWIARDKGFFRKAGLDVEIRGYPSGNAAMEALRAGEVDVATAADLVVAKRSFGESDLRVLADICRYWNKGMIGRKDRGINGPADLRGKRIAVPATSSAEHNLMVFLALQGLSSRDVTVIDLNPKALVEAMVSGQVDAAIVWQPHVQTIEKRLGDNAVKLMDGGTEAHLLLAARQATILDQGEPIKKLLRGLVRAEEWVRSNPKEAKAYMIERFALDPAYLDLLWPRMQFNVSLPQEILEAMDSEARWLAQSNTLGAKPNFADTVHPGLLSAVKPSAVGIFTR